ncbi:nitroreductase family protein [Micromonospora sp. NPDC023956]|uniref:nitroreductase family protein n=1 Tax=Micromonospora sp. NPDC023956 TaxID=3155722 RepID=UPI0033DBC953
MAELSPLLAARWSPYAFDPSVELTEAEAASLLEAARWAPSAGNRQPWRFLLGRRADEAYKRIFVHLAAGNQRWAGRASALLLGAYLVPTPGGPAPADHHPVRGADDPGQVQAAHHPVRGADDPGQVQAAHHPVRGADDPGQAAYDLGQAVAHLTVQAGTLGLHVHQMAGFDRAGIAIDLALPDDVRPHVVVAVGRLGDPRSLPGDLRRRETELRRRRPVTDLILGPPTG